MNSTWHVAQGQDRRFKTCTLHDGKMKSRRLEIRVLMVLIRISHKKKSQGKRTLYISGGDMFIVIIVFFLELKF